MLSGQLFQRNLFAAVEAIFGAIVTSHTHRNIISQTKYGQIINCDLTILIVSLFSLCRFYELSHSRDGTGQHFCSPARPELTRNRPARVC